MGSFSHIQRYAQSLEVRARAIMRTRRTSCLFPQLCATLCLLLTFLSSCFLSLSHCLPLRPLRSIAGKPTHHLCKTDPDTKKVMIMNKNLVCITICYFSFLSSFLRNYFLRTLLYSTVDYDLHAYFNSSVPTHESSMPVPREAWQQTKNITCAQYYFYFQYCIVDFARL